MIQNKKMLFQDFPSFNKITKNVKEQNSKRTFTGGVRINNGMYRTDEETKTYIQKSLCRTLP